MLKRASRTGPSSRTYAPVPREVEKVDPSIRYPDTGQAVLSTPNAKKQLPEGALLAASSFHCGGSSCMFLCFLEDFSMAVRRRLALPWLAGLDLS